MQFRRVTLAFSLAGASLLAVPSSANATTPTVSITVSDRLIVNYLNECVPIEAELDWVGEGTGVTKVVMDSIDPNGEKVYSETAKPGEPHGFGPGCASVAEFGKWLMRVTAYDHSGHVLARTTEWYMEKGNTAFKEFNASPEPVRSGHTITVAGRLLHIKFDNAPWYVSYSGKSIRVDFKAAGTTAWKSMGSTTTGHDGRFSKHLTARVDGTWRAYFAGTSNFDGGVSPSDHVDVR